MVYNKPVGDGGGGQNSFEDSRTPITKEKPCKCHYNVCGNCGQPYAIVKKNTVDGSHNCMLYVMSLSVLHCHNSMLLLLILGTVITEIARQCCT